MWAVLRRWRCCTSTPSWRPPAILCRRATPASPRTCALAARAGTTLTGCWPRCATRPRDRRPRRAARLARPHHPLASRWTPAASSVYRDRGKIPGRLRRQPHVTETMQGTSTRAPRISAGRVPLFCDTALAGRIERVEAQLIAQASEAARRRTGTAGFVIPIAGGVASFAGEGSPYNKVAGLGFGGVPDATSLAEVERAFAACGSAVQVELAHLADPAISALLAERGYRLESFENVLGRDLAGGFQRVMPPGV